MTQRNEVEALIGRLDEMNSSVCWEAMTLISKLQAERDEARDKALEEAANYLESSGMPQASSKFYAPKIRNLKPKDTAPQQKDRQSDGMATD